MVIQESHPGPYNDKGEKCFEFTLSGLGGRLVGSGRPKLGWSHLFIAEVMLVLS